MAGIKVDGAESRFVEIERQLSLPETVADREKYAALTKEYTDLSPIVEHLRAIRDEQRVIDEATEMLADADFSDLAMEEINDAAERLETLRRELDLLLIPKDPDDDRSVIMEIRAGVGGEEAALFAAELYRMYAMYAQSRGYALSVLREHPTELGGVKAIVFSLKGKGVYGRLRFESGAHRVQRIPVTESNGKLQTSTATVAVLPEVSAVEVVINPADVKLETCKSSGAGGQHINKTESAVRLTHLPTGLVVECDSERSQLQNRETAMEMLRARLYDIRKKEQEASRAEARREQVGGGDRSEKIRTYHFPDSRVTDHRIGLSVYNLDKFLNGDMDAVLDALVRDAEARRLSGEE